MAESHNPNRWPDGLSFSAPFPLLPIGRIGGTYYWNPGTATAPRWTVNRSLGAPGAGLETVFLAPGMTSRDTLGFGVSGNASTFVPSVSLNATFPDRGSLLPPLAAPKVTSVGAGVGTPNMSPSFTTTVTPGQIVDWLQMLFAPRAMGPIDEASPLVRGLTSRLGTIGAATAAPPVGHLNSGDRRSLGGGMDDWKASVAPSAPQKSIQSPSDGQPAGLLGLIQDAMRDKGY